ncbi:MAG: T9SS type A sorting domain-containing protein, partial [candidate division Zixibacteria bacterium]|nr:T9SS type A sorting domain-containing protein [candidate division Zixibacteria bacterium]
LIHIGFYVDGGTGDDVDLEIVSFQYNEVSPYYVFFDDQEYYSDWNPDHPGTELIYTDNKSIGDFLVCRDLYVAGAIKYMSNGSPVCGAEVTLAYKADPDAVDPPAIDDITVETTCNMPCQEDCRGSYFIPDVTSEYNYCVGAWKDDEDDYERAITAFDASLILRDAVGQFHLDNYYQEVASDVSGDCTVSAYDASLILQWLVGDFDYFPKNEADETNWIFVALDHDPEHLCPVEEYCDQLTSSEHWDFGAMILGDVSGNWSLSDEELPKVTGGFVNEYVEIRPVRGSAAGVQEYDLVAKSAEAFSSQFVVKVLDGSAERVSVTAGSKDWFHASRAEGSTVRVATAGPRASADGVIARIVVDGSAEFVVEQLIINEAALVGSVSSDGLVQLPTSFALGNNYPNPFNPSTTIDYTLPATGTVELSVFNVLGERVKTLASGVHEAGVHQVEWDGTNSAGQAVSSGIYFYRLSGTNVSQTKKMMLLK